MKVGVVRNPASGRGHGCRGWSVTEPLLRSGCDLTVLETTPENRGRGLATELASKGCEIVVAAGGDGTVCEVMNGLIGTDSALAVLPFGTGNDFARTLGIGTNIETAVGAVLQGKRRRVDLGHWTQQCRQGHFINVAGCGFDAAVADRVNKRYRHLRGRAAYLAAILGTLRRYQPTEVSICVDGETIRQSVMLCAVANAKSYGGGLEIAPIAQLDDGLLDLVIVGHMSKAEFVRSFPQVMKGSHLAHPKVIHRTFRTMELETSHPAPFLVDGELLAAKSTKVQVVPRALSVMFPQ